MKYKKIKDIDQDNKYCQIYEKFCDDTKHKDAMELLEILIEELDNRSTEVDEQMNPAELIDCLLAENNLSRAKLAKDISISRQLISDILNHRRNLSKNVINKLSSYFSINSSVLSRSYELR